ncbi:MAG: App1 family protein [Planctomycetaceae bacterium]
MTLGGMFRAAKRALLRVVHLLARPVRGDRGKGGVLIQPYRGYATRDEVYLMGRVFRQSGIGASMRERSPRRDLLDVGRRLLRRGVGAAVLVARVGDAKDRFQADADGYFRVRLRTLKRLAGDQLWHRVELELVEPAESVGGEGARVQGHVFVAPESARRVIISDIDDTVMYTGVVNKIMMVWRLFIQGPRSRVAFPGVASLYRALYHGASRKECNPMLYVSRAPWSIYEMLEEFFKLHRIPIGPILFLREWGISLQRPFPRRAEDHKLLLIRDMLDLYRDLPFVLIGDSGQHDPEVYTQIVHEHPGRVVAVYIRNVSRSPDRIQAIEALAKEVLSAGSTLLLAADSFSIAEHAAELGLIPPESLAEVLRERDAPP